MNDSLLDVEVSFDLDAFELTVTDNTDYAGQSITASKVAGIITALRANTTFYSNTSFSSPDIVPSVSTEKTISGPSGALPQSIYGVNYSIQVLDEVQNQTSGTMGSATALSYSHSDNTTLLNALRTNADSVYLRLYNGVTVLGDRLVGSNFTYNSGTISVTTASLASFASVTSFRIVTYYHKNLSFNFCNTLPTVSLCVTVDCLRAQISVVDQTVFLSGQGVSSHLITLRYPTNAAGTPVASPVTTDEYSMIVGPNIYSGGYNISVSALVSYTQSDGLVVSGTIVGYSYPNVECSPLWACLLPCLRQMLASYLAIQKKGGNNTVIGEQMFVIGQYKMQWDIAIQNLDTVAATEIFNAAKLYIGENGADCKCECGCGSSDGAPTLITPAFS